jgi:hypothetical protein
MLIILQDLGDFVMRGPRAMFENRQLHLRAEKYWPLFLSTLLESKGLDGFQVNHYPVIQSATKLYTDAT